MPPDPFGHRQHPLAKRDSGQDVVDHVGGGLDHATGGAGRTDVAALARKGDQEIVAAAGAVHTGKTVGQDAALQVLAKRGLDVEGDVGGEIVIMSCVGQIGLEMLTDGLMQCLASVNASRASFQEKDESGIYRALPLNRYARMKDLEYSLRGLSGAVMDLGRFDSIEAVLEQARCVSGRKGRVSREIARARRLGYRCSPVEPQMHLSEIREINLSKPSRGGRAMRRQYRAGENDLRRHYDAFMSPGQSRCPTHNRQFWGVFAPDGGPLVGYIHLEHCGNYVRYSRLLGHGDHLRYGVMYLLHYCVVEKLLGTDMQYILYGGMFNRGEGGGLWRWKTRALFEPRILIYDEAGEWQGRSGMSAATFSA